MPIDLIAALFVGCFAGGFTWLVYRARRRRAPRFLIPMLVGAGILSYTIYSEYTWAPRMIATFPPDFKVIDRLTRTAAWQPWTYLFPRVDRLVVVDLGTVRHNEKFPGLAMVDVLLFERLATPRRIVQIIDCPNARRADVTTNEQFLEGELPPEDRWAGLHRDSGLYQAICGG